MDIWNIFSQFGVIASMVGLACGLFFFVYSVRYYLISILVLMKDQQAIESALTEMSKENHLGFTVRRINMSKHIGDKNKAMSRSAKLLGFKMKRVKNELLISEIGKEEAGFLSKRVKVEGLEKYNELINKIRNIYWKIRQENGRLVVCPAKIGLRKRLHALMILIIKKSDFDEIKNTAASLWSAAKSYLFEHKSWTVEKSNISSQSKELLAAYSIEKKVLGFSVVKVGLTKKGQKLLKNGHKYINLANEKLIDNPIDQPFVSLHLAFYNEENVADRVVQACLNQDYTRYEIVIADDSNDQTPMILAKYNNNPKIKIVRRDNRDGFKGGALKVAIEKTDPRAEYIITFDADFVPAPGTIKAFLHHFYKQNGNTFSLDKDKNLAAIQAYQWHVLNKDENFVTAGIRFGFAGGYMVERTAQQYLGAMKMIAGSVFIIRRDVLQKFGWQMDNGYTSIVEDWNLTLRMYIQGWKIGYTPDIKVPAECVNSLNKLVKQQVRWAEGHTWNAKKYFWKVMLSPNMTIMEKIEFMYFAPYYLQSALFILGTFGWIVGELIFHAKVPGWTATLGWSLVFTNLMALPVMCIAGLVLERGEDKDYNFLPFLTYIYYIIPSLAYAALRGLVSPTESGWIRTKKTGAVTDVLMESKMAGSNEELVRKDTDMLEEEMKETAKKLHKDHPLYAYKPTTNEELEKGRLWIQLKRVPRLGLILILLMGSILGGLTYLASQEKGSAMVIPTVTGYLNANHYISYYAASSPQSATLGRSTPTHTWYSDACPTGNEPGGIAAGNYSTTIKLTSKPQVNKTYSFTVGYADQNGGNYQYITSTNYVINQSTPSILTINLGNGPAISCNKDNKKKLVYTISYVSSEGNCDTPEICNSVQCNNSVAYQQQSDQKSSVLEKSNILPQLEIIPKAYAMVAVPETCTPGDTCINMDDTYFYIPLKSSTSGTYPTKGTSADSVTLTRSAPTSSGYLDFEYTMTGLPDNFTDATISMNFTDLDLQGDTITSGSNVATLYETFTLMDANNNVLATLNSSSEYNDNFTWSIAIPDNLISDNSLSLKARFTSTTTLTQGTSMSLTNTQEGVQDISLCGTVTCVVPETITMTTTNGCSSININWSQYTDQTIDGYKLLRSTTDPVLTYPEDGYYQYLSGQTTVSYTDTGITQGQSYYYRIGAYKNGVIVAYSNTQYITAQSVCPKVSPVLECVDQNPDGTYKAHFGYNNTYSTSTTIAIGNKNKFTPNPINRGQPTIFTPGRVVDSFQVNFNGSNLVWYLKSPNGQTATATVSSSSPRCTTNCCCDNLVIEYNNGISSITTPSIQVPEYSLLLFIPFGWLIKKMRDKNNLVSTK